MKKFIDFFIAIAIPILINAVFKFFLKEYQRQEITHIIFSVYSVFFATLIASTYSFDTTSYSESFEKKLDGNLALVRKKAIMFYVITVLLFIVIDILIGAAYQVSRFFSSVGFSCMYSAFLLIGETQLYRLRDDIKRQYRKERYSQKQPGKY